MKATTEKVKYILNISPHDPDVAYLMLPKHKGEGVGSVVEQKTLRELLPEYKGPDIYFDFDNNGVLVGIELMNDEEL